jgi:hypothetical protein
MACVWAVADVEGCDSARCSLLTRGESGLLPAFASRPRGVSFLYAFLLLVPYRHVNEVQLAPRAAVLTGLSKVF